MRTHWAISLAALGGGVASAQQYVPIGLQSSSFNEDTVVESTAPQVALPYVTASMDDGTENPANNTWLEQGYDKANPTYGVPVGGMTFTSASASNHNFYIQPLTPTSGTVANNVALLGGTGFGPSTDTLTFTTPQAFSGLSLFGAGADGGGSITVTMNYVNGNTATATVTVSDWFSGSTNSVYDVQERDYINPGSGTSTLSGALGNGNPNLYQFDFTPADTTDAIASVTLSNFSNTGRADVQLFGISGVISNSTNAVTYGGGTFANGSGGYVNGNTITFTDTAAGNVTVAANTLPGALIFTNDTGAPAYNLTGGAISGSTTLTVSGGGTVVLSNSNTYTGDTIITNGTLVVASGGAVASNTINVGSGATFNVASGGSLTAASPFLVDNGTVIFNNPARYLYELAGAGQVTANGTALTVLRMNASGSIQGTGSLLYQYGTFTVNQPTSLSLAGGVTVNSSGATLVVNDGSGQAGLYNGTPFTTTLNGATLTGNGVWGSNLAITAAGATITGSSNGTLTLNGSISGTGPVTLESTGPSTLNLNGSSTGYTGAVTIPGDGNVYDIETVNVNANNGLGIGDLAISPSSSFQVLVNLNGANQSSHSLSSPVSSNFQINNSGNLSTLTISNGNTSAGVAANFGAGISGNIAVVKSGTGNQTLSGNNSYSGGTTVTGGTLTLGNSNALGGGSNPVTLGGGTLELGAATSFTNANFSTFKLNYGSGGNPATVQSGNVLQLNDGNTNEANSAFMTTPVVISDKAGFTASFAYTPDGEADGITFVIAADPRGAAAVSSGNGSGLGYSGGNKIVNSGAVAFEIYPFGSSEGTQFVTGGNQATQYQSTGNVELGYVYINNGYYGAFSPTTVTLTYNGVAGMLTEALSGPDLYTSNGGVYVTTATDTVTYTGIDFSSILGGPSNGSATGYLGFTGGTGGAAATNQITNFSFNNNGGAVSISNPITVAVNASSTIQFPLGASSTGVSVGAITVNPGGKLVLSTLAATNASRGVLTVPSITFTPSSSTTATYTGQFDIGKNDLDITSQSLAQVTAMVATGYNLTGGGKWNGPGITSSLAASNSLHLTAVGVIQNNQGGTPIYTATNPFDGTVPGTGDVLVKYTYFGDANLDGKVDGSDYSLIDAGYASKGTLTGWYYGDFNYDGVIDGSDYALIDNAFNNQGSAQTVYNAAIVASETAQVASAPASAVPEPASLGLLAVSGLVLVRRRSRR